MTDTRELSEKYSGATMTSHLEVKPTRCDVDYLIAAGWVHEGLGTALFRLATEWDLAGGDYRLALRHARQVELQAYQIKRNAARMPDGGAEDAAKLLAEAALLLDQARREAITAKALAMVHMKTLHEARDAIGNYARGLANRAQFMQPDAKVNTLAAQALQMFLDATCPACMGRGFNGGHLKPVVWCNACGASGKAHHALSKTEQDSAFIRRLLAEMDLKCHRVQQQMSRWLRQRG